MVGVKKLTIVIAFCVLFCANFGIVAAVDAVQSDDIVDDATGKEPVIETETEIQVEEEVASSKVDDAAVSNIVVELNNKSFEELVYRGKQVWVVFFHHSEQCGAPCDQQKSVVEEAARLSKGVVQYGTLDLADKENLEVAKALSVQGVPMLKIFSKPGFLNKYSRKFWRQSEMFNGQLSARSLRRAAENSMPDDLVTLVTSDNSTSFISDTLKSGKSVTLLFSSKDRVAPMTKALSMLTSDVSVVGQVNPEGTDKLGAVAKKYGVESLPALIVISPSDASVGNKFEGSLGTSSPSSIAEFIQLHSPQMPDSENSDSSAADSSDSTKTLRIMSNMIRLANELPQPAVLAFYVGEAPEGSDLSSPEEGWKAFESKVNSWGVTTGVIVCEQLRDETTNSYPQDCADLEESGASGWVYRLYEYADMVPESPFADNYQELLKDMDTKKEISQIATLEDAKRLVASSIPDRVMRVNSQIFQTWMSTIITAPEAGVPVILLAKKEDVPAMLLSVASVTKGLASIAYMGNPTPQMLEQIGVPASTKLPLLFGLVEGLDPNADSQNGQAPEGAKMMQLAAYDKSRFGKFSFHSIAGFIVSLASEVDRARTLQWIQRYGDVFGLKAAEENQSQSQDRSSSQKVNNAVIGTEFPANGLDASTWDSQCAGHAGNVICVIGFVDGDPANLDLENQIQVMKEAHATALKRPSAAARFAFAWVDATCHAEFAQSLGVDLAILPAVVAYHPGKNLSLKHVLGYSEDKVSTFLEGIKSSQGRGFAPVVQLSKPSDVNCAELESRKRSVDDDDTGNKETDDEMEAMLAEIREEEERERKKLAKEAKEQAKIAKAEEKERKERAKAEAEAARNGGEPKSKKKKKKKKKKKASKDEL